MHLTRQYLNKPFSHIYVESKIKDLAFTKEIINKFKLSTIIEIKHYKDVFAPSNQNLILSKKSPSLILAQNDGNLVFNGSPGCENFGFKNFYYTSLVKNCIYSCEYCYLAGMYPSANLVLFVNIDDFFKKIDELLKDRPIYLCISYDTDLLALDYITGYLAKFLESLRERPNLTIECRTKSSNLRPLKNYYTIFGALPQNFILAFSLSPSEIIDRYEHNTAKLNGRIKAISSSLELGLSPRLCFDPILKSCNISLYTELIDLVFSVIEAKKIRDVSVGSFRVSKVFLQRMRKKLKTSSLLHYPYILDNGFYSYGKDENELLTGTLVNSLLRYLPNEKIFVWK